MAIGSAKSMIDTGEWQTLPQPKLLKSKKEYKILFRIGFFYKNFKFLGEFLMDRETKDTCWFIFPYYKEFSKKLLVFSDIIKTSILWQRNIYDITIRNDNLKKLFLATFRESCIFYSDDLCGTDFKQAIDFDIRR